MSDENLGLIKTQPHANFASLFMKVSSVHEAFVILVILGEKFIDISSGGISSSEGSFGIPYSFEVDLALEVSNS